MVSFSLSPSLPPSAKLQLICTGSYPLALGALASSRRFQCHRLHVGDSGAVITPFAHLKLFMKSLILMQNMPIFSIKVLGLDNCMLKSFRVFIF
ncbi:hypothetical protein WN944_003769 [Citrus x changshan-huyou]|uniref:Uncharacterized protein n=1 Tax=Citrus x changshan-huyou TaxID=2935761 RepID=A0AAP0LZW7_9ROSI